ncbi:DUF1643 domain-containing protein [Terrarubrum flagellatum]|uniref:DUF1643 domain-containing protein n=1 Tax=Terrirubrum flagellatum TaxID=2895980 RepID=UPI0031450E00
MHDIWGREVSGAVISDCGTYRYRLWRMTEHRGLRAGVIMVNPSTADADRDDHTIRKLLGFAERHRWSRIDVVNKFALRSRDIRGPCSRDASNRT